MHRLLIAALATAAGCVSMDDIGVVRSASSDGQSTTDAGTGMTQGYYEGTRHGELKFEMIVSETSFDLTFPETYSQRYEDGELVVSYAPERYATIEELYFGVHETNGVYAEGLFFGSQLLRVCFNTEGTPVSWESYAYRWDPPPAILALADIQESSNWQFIEAGIFSDPAT